MDKELLEETISCLRDASEMLYDREYDKWYNSNTTRSFTDWCSEHTKDQIERMDSAAEKLEEHLTQI